MLLAEELQHCLFVESIAHCAHMVAIGNHGGAGVPEGLGERPGWAGNLIAAAAYHERRYSYVGQLVRGKGCARRAHARGERRRVFSGLSRKIAEHALHG
jgi:hypothetical protein